MANLFKIEAPASICFSGGRTSGYMLYRILEAHQGDLGQEIFVVFENTGDECEETLEFINEVSKRWRVNIIWLEYDDVFKIENYITKSGTVGTRRRSYFKTPTDTGFKIVDFKSASRRGEPYEKMLDYYAEFKKVVKNQPPVLPTIPRRMCTAHLKIKVNNRYMKSLNYNEFNAVIGIRYDEPKRHAHMMALNDADNESYYNVLPLYEAKVTKHEVHDFWRKQDFDLGLDINSDEGNCRYCFLKAKHKLIAIMRKEIHKNGIITDEMLRWIARERRSGQVFRRDRPNYSGLVRIALSNEDIKQQDLDEPIIDCICG